MGFRSAIPTATAAVVLILVSAAMAAEMPPVDLNEPLTDEQCVRLALERNYDILLAEDQYGQAKASRLQAWGGLLPSVNGGWDYTHDRRGESKYTNSAFPTGGFSTPATQSDTRSYSIDVSQNLLSIPTLLRIAQQKRAANASAMDIRDAEQMVALAVRQQFFSLIEAIKLLDVSREDLRLASEEQKRTESLFEVGSVARTDVLKARVRVAEAQSALTTAENNNEIQRARLAKALALPADSPLKVVENLDPRAEEPDSVAAYSEAAQNRPDLSAARLRLGSAAAGKKAAYASKLPYLAHRYHYNSFNGSSDQDFDPSIDGVDIRRVGFDGGGWSYSLGVTWNIFDGLVTESSIVSAKAQELSAQHGMENLSLQVQLDVKEAILAQRASRRQIETAREGLASAEEDLKLSQERYSVGLGTILELIDAQVNVTRARTGEVQAMAALKRAEAQLDRAVGRKTW